MQSMMSISAFLNSRALCPARYRRLIWCTCSLVSLRKCLEFWMESARPSTSLEILVTVSKISKFPESFRYTGSHIPILLPVPIQRICSTVSILRLFIWSSLPSLPSYCKGPTISATDLSFSFFVSWGGVPDLSGGGLRPTGVPFGKCVGFVEKVATHIFVGTCSRAIKIPEAGSTIDVCIEWVHRRW